MRSTSAAYAQVPDKSILLQVFNTPLGLHVEPGQAGKAKRPFVALASGITTAALKLHKSHA